MKNNITTFFLMCIALITGYIISRGQKDMLKSVLTVPASLPVLLVSAVFVMTAKKSAAAKTTKRIKKVITKKVGSTDYYSQIDNSRVEQVDTEGDVINLKGSLPYSYTLSAYDENGVEKEITFGTSGELRDGVFIRLTVMPIRGVLDWREVRYSELPSTVQTHYAEPTNG